MAITVRRYIRFSEGDFSSAGSLRSVKLLVPGFLRSVSASTQKISAAAAAMIRKVVRQPTYRPTVLPSGSPTIIANDEPETIRPRAVELLPSGAILTARGVTIDQNIACEHATPMRESISMLKLVETPDSTWLATNSATIDSISFLLSVRANTSISGSEAIATTHA